MKLTHATLAVVCVGMTMTACQKEKQPQPVSQLKAGSNIEEFFNANRAAALNTFTVNPQTGGTFSFQNGSSFLVSPNALRNADGGPLAENVSIKVNNVIGRWQMLALNMPTETEEELLTSGGSASIRMTTASGTTVTMPSGGVTMVIPGSLTGGIDNSMTAWEGATGAQPRDIVWIPGTGLDITPEAYRLPVRSRDIRTNVDRPILTKATGVIPQVYLPSEFTETNTEIFVSVNGELNSLGSLDLVVAGSNGNYWTDNAAFLSQGSECNLIVVALIDGTLRARIQPFTAAANQNITIASVPATTTNALRAAVQSLP